MKYTAQELQEQYQEAEYSSWDGKCRLVDNSDKVKADGEVWGIVNDHGNVELCHKGKNGHLYFHGGLV